MAGANEVRGQRIVVRFDADKCMHSRKCVLAHPEVFEPNAEGDWIHPDAASPQAIAEVAHACPSGAITYESLNGMDQEAAPVVNVVQVLENGPLVFHAPVRIEGEDEGFRAALCRCGASKNKPYCDGSHVEAGFKATGEPAVVDSQPLCRRDGDVRLDVIPNGPLQVKGPVEIVSGTGTTVDRVKKAYLCRCGASENKPYCDGSHKSARFRG